MKVASLYVDRFTNQVGWLMSQWALSPWECAGRGGMPAHEEEPLPSEDVFEYPSPLLLRPQACLSQGWLGKNCTQFTEKMLLPSACLQSSLTSSHKLLRTLLFGLNKIDHIFRLYYFFFSWWYKWIFIGKEELSRETAANEEWRWKLPVYTRPPSYVIQEAFQFVISSPEMSNAFPLNLILLDSYQKGIQEEHDKVA